MPPPGFLPVEERKRKALKLLGPGVRKASLHFAIVFVERAKNWREAAIFGTLVCTENHVRE